MIFSNNLVGSTRIASIDGVLPYVEDIVLPLEINVIIRPISLSIVISNASYTRTVGLTIDVTSVPATLSQGLTVNVTPRSEVITLPFSISVVSLQTKQVKLQYNIYRPMSAVPLVGPPDPYNSANDGNIAYGNPIGIMWSCVVIYDGTDISNYVTGSITVSKEVSSARTVQLNVIYDSAIFGSLGNTNLRDRPLQVLYRYKADYNSPYSQITIFNGYTATVTFNFESGTLVMVGSDKIADKVSGTVTSGPYASYGSLEAFTGIEWSKAIFGEVSDLAYDNLLNLMQGVQGDADLDVNGKLVLHSWLVQTPYREFTNEDIIEGSLSVDYDTSNASLNKVDIDMVSSGTTFCKEQASAYVPGTPSKRMTLGAVFSALSGVSWPMHSGTDIHLKVNLGATNLPITRIRDIGSNPGAAPLVGGCTVLYENRYTFSTTRTYGVTISSQVENGAYSLTQYSSSLEVDEGSLAEFTKTTTTTLTATITSGGWNVFPHTRIITRAGAFPIQVTTYNAIMNYTQPATMWASEGGISADYSYMRSLASKIAAKNLVLSNRTTSCTFSTMIDPFMEVGKYATVNASTAKYSVGGLIYITGFNHTLDIESGACITAISGHSFNVVPTLVNLNNEPSPMETRISSANCVVSEDSPESCRIEISSSADTSPQEYDYRAMRTKIILPTATNSLTLTTL